MYAKRGEEHGSRCAGCNHENERSWMNVNDGHAYCDACWDGLFPFTEAGIRVFIGDVSKNFRL